MKFKKFLAVVLSVVMICCALPFNTFTASALTSGYLTYTITDNEVSITDCDTSISGELIIPDSLDGYPVIKIGANSFSDCTGLTSITIPDSVTNIDSSAFYGCSCLISMTLPFIGSSRTASGNSNALFGYIFGKGKINQSYATSSWASFAIPSSLRSVTITDDSNIPYGAFYNCVNLTDITLSDNTTSIGTYAFYNCTGLTSIEIPKSVTDISSGAFGECTNLINMTLPFVGSSRTANGEYDQAFGYIFGYTAGIPVKYYVPTSIRKVTITDTSQIPNSAFSNCSNLTEVEFPESVINFGENTFYSCSNLKKVTLPNNLTCIPRMMFYNCKSLTDVIIPESVTSINSQSFEGCSSLVSVTIPDKTNTIAYSAFRGCSALESIKLPVSVTKIVEYAFNGCTNLENVYYGGDKADRGVITIGDYNTPLTDATWTYNYCDHIYSSSVVTPPTCTTQGYTTYTCEKCGNVYDGDYVSALGHSYGEWRVIVPADCENAGSHTRICNVCGNVENGVIPAIGHNYVETVVAPTCTEQGYTEHVCSNCNDSYIDSYVDAIGHNYISTVFAPTCTEQGYIEWVCLNCGDSYKESYIDATGHNFGEWITDNQPTCTSEGSRYRICAVCEFTEYEELSVLEHNYSTEWTIDSQPDCVKNGSKSRQCVNCGAKTDITVIQAYGHAFDSWKYESVPTCTVAGKIVCSCLLCGEKKTITIEPYGHDFSTEWTVDTEPTCTETGVKSHHCSRCDVTNDETEISALGHNYTAVISKPNCTENGYTEHICTACGDFYKTDIVDANGHTFIHFEQKPATCTENGYEAYEECSVCGYTTFKEIIATGHNYQSTESGKYTCTHCNNVISSGETHTYVKTIVKATEDQDGYTQYTCTDCGYYYRADITECITAPKFSVSDSIVGAGKTVIVNVSISNNPGIYSFTLGIDYDEDNMTLTEVRNSGTLGGELTSGKKILWFNNTKQDSYYNGEIFQLVFSVSAYATAQDYSVSLTYNAGNIINYDLEDVNLAVESGVITVESFTAGDLNNDGKVNNKDLVLMTEIFSRNYTVYYHGKQHNDKNKVKNFNVFGKTAMNELKNYDMVALGVTVSRVALDCNNDGVINNHDLLTMMKYLRGEEITIW